MLLTFCRVGALCSLLFGLSLSSAFGQTVRLGTANSNHQTFAITYTSVPSKIYWPQEGLDVKLQGLGGANAIIEALDAGLVDVAAPAASAVFALMQARPNTDLVAFYTHTSGFNAMPAVPRNSTIQTIRDLEGKTIGVQNLANSQVALTKALLTLEGGDASKLKFRAVGEGIEMVRALQTNQVDALAVFDAMYALVEGEGVPLRILSSASINAQKVGFIGVLVAKRSYFEKNRETLTKLARGMAKASVFAKANPEAAVRIHWEAFPASKPRGLSEANAMRRGVEPMLARLENTFEVEGLWGNSTPEQINGYVNLLLEGGVLKQRVEASKVWDPSLLKEANNFDRQAVIAEARASK